MAARAVTRRSAAQAAAGRTQSSPPARKSVSPTPAPPARSAAATPRTRSRNARRAVVLEAHDTNTASASSPPSTPGSLAAGSVAVASPTRRRKTRAGASATATGSSAEATWDARTQRLAALSTVAFVWMNVPQVIMNAQQLAAGNPGALAVIQWAGHMSGLLGNLILFSYFAAKREWGATAVQAVGVASTSVLLAQVFYAGFFPSSVFWPLTAVVLAGSALGAMRLCGAVHHSVWSAWQAALGVIGLATLPQALWTAAHASSGSMVPGAVGAATGVLLMGLQEAGRLPTAWVGLRASLSAWTATLLFMTMAVPQLMNNIRDPASTVALSVPTLLLGIAGNGLMVPRALHTRDLIWFCGSTWGAAVMGWAQIATVARAGFMPLPIFVAITCLLWGGLAAVLWLDAAARGRGASPLPALREMLRPKQG